MIRRAVAWLARHGHWRAARLLARLTRAPTDRAHLLLDPQAEDACADWTRSASARTCRSDGHYLCDTCRRRALTEDEVTP